MARAELMLILEFVKAIAGPAGAVVAVTIAGSMALRGFRYQKLLEHRLAWYESLLDQIHRCSGAYAKAHRLKTDEAIEECIESMQAARALGHRAGLYADQAGFDAVTMWVERFPKKIDSEIPEPKAFADTCSSLAEGLFNEIRRDLKLAPLRLPWSKRQA